MTTAAGRQATLRPAGTALIADRFLQWYGRTRQRRVVGPLLPAGLNVIAVAALTFFTFLRLPGQTAETLWAEDGGVFLHQALTSPAFFGLFDPYEGYLHVVPRTIAHIALRLGPLDDYALRITWMSCLCVGAIGVAVYHLSGQLVPSRITRILLALIPSLLPVAPFEALGNTANLHWYMLWLAVWLLLYSPSHLIGTIAVAAAAFAAAATEIQTIAFLPVLVWAVWRDRRRLPAALALTLGQVMQGVTFLTFPRSTSPDAVPWDVLSVVMGWVLQGLVSLLQPSSATVGITWNLVGGWLLLPPILLVGLLLIVGWRNGGAARVGTLGFLTASGMFWVAAQVLNNRSFMNYAELSRDEWFHFGYLRYAVASGMFGLGAAAFAAGRVEPRIQDHSRLHLSPIERLAYWGPAAIAGAVIVVMVAGYFPSYSARSSGPVWSDQIASARAACEANPGLQSATARVAPAGWQFEQVPIPCSRLR